MNLGQSMLALGGLSLLGIMVLSTNKSLLLGNERLNQGQYGITAISLAQSLSEEAMSKYFDAKTETEITGEIAGTANLTSVSALGPGITEQYRDGTNDFNDFDDYNHLFIVYKSTNPADTAETTGSHWESSIPNLDSKYFVKSRVQYVDITKLGDTNPLNDTSAVPTWHKRLTVTVINATTKDTLIYPTIMSYWN